MSVLVRRNLKPLSTSERYARPPRVWTPFPTLPTEGTPIATSAAETKNVTASTSSTLVAPIRTIRSPPNSGPAACPHGG